MDFLLAEFSFLLQHVLLALKVGVAYFIPDVPKWVDVEMAKIAYQSKLALQKEVRISAQ